ncbi:MAG: radical SAM protein [Candidatus Altarchaeaceae archaeon]
MNYVDENPGSLLNLGITADKIRRKKVKDIVYFVKNFHINYTNICVSRCELCAYYRNKNDKDAYTLSIDEILEKVKYAKEKYDITELHIVGSLNPEISIEYCEEMLRKIKKNFPEISIKAFTAAEIHFLSKNTKNSVKEILERFKDAGLDFMPGGGAEILDDKIREKICPNKLKSEEYLKIHEIAHNLGIRSNATMLYGHIESNEDRVRHILKIRELQEKTHKFLSFIPLKFHPENTNLYRKGIVKNFTSGLDDLKTIAISRILLNNFDNITAYWVMLGKKMAQIALHYGANDLNGTVGEENITYAAGKISERSATVEELKNLIKEAKRIPAIRTSDYKILEILK